MKHDLPADSILKLDFAWTDAILGKGVLAPLNEVALRGAKVEK